MYIFLLSDFINDFNNIKCIDIESKKDDEYFEYKDNEALFSYKDVFDKKLYDTNYLFYNIDTKGDTRFLCADFSNGKGKFYLSNDYKKMVIFDKKTDDFLSEKLETESLDDAFLDSRNINIHDAYNSYLCTASTIKEINSAIGKIMIEYDDDYNNAILLSPDEYKTLNAGNDNSNALFSYMFKGERYLAFDSKSLKKVSYEKCNKYELNEIISINNIFSKREEETYIAIKKPFQLSIIKQEDILNDNFYNIICSINKEKFYILKAKDTLYLKKVKDSNLSSSTFHNMEKKNEKYKVEYCFSKEEAIKIIDWLFHTLNVLNIDYKILFYVKNNQIEKNILDYNSLINKLDETNNELELEKNKLKDLTSKIFNDEIELKQLENIKRENEKQKVKIKKLSDEKEELKSKNEEYEKKLEVIYKSFLNVLSFEKSYFYDLINFKLDDNIYKRFVPVSSYCPDWAVYDSLVSNKIYHSGDETRTGYRNDYEDINNRFVELLKNDYIVQMGKPKTLNILLCGCGDLLEVKSFIKSFSNYPGHINLLCLDLNLWPENFLNEIKPLYSEKFGLYFYKCDFYNEIMNNSFVSGFDVIYFSRCLLLGEQSNGCSIDRIISLLYRLRGKKIYFSQVVSYKNPDAFEFENSLIYRIRQSGFRLSIVNGYGTQFSRCARYYNGLNYFLYLIN